MFLRLLLFIVFIFSSLPVYGQEESFPFLAEVTADKVNIRAGESANFEKIDQLLKGSEVLVVGHNFSWYKIRLPKTAASYISEKYVKVLDDKNGEITATTVNIRAGQDVNNSVLGQVNTGDKIKILAKWPGWYKIEPIDESYGWVSDKLIAFKSNDISRFVAPAPVSIPEEKPVAEVTSPDKSEAITGTLHLIGETTIQDLPYEVIINNSPAYHVKDLPREIFDQFVNYDVSIVGDVQSDPNAKTLPVISVTKIQIVY